MEGASPLSNRARRSAAALRSRASAPAVPWPPLPKLALASEPLRRFFSVRLPACAACTACLLGLRKPYEFAVIL